MIVAAIRFNTTVASEKVRDARRNQATASIV